MTKIAIEVMPIVFSLLQNKMDRCFCNIACPAPSFVNVDIQTTIVRLYLIYYFLTIIIIVNALMYRILYSVYLYIVYASFV